MQVYFDEAKATCPYGNPISGVEACQYIERIGFTGCAALDEFTDYLVTNELDDSAARAVFSDLPDDATVMTYGEFWDAMGATAFIEKGEWEKARQTERLSQQEHFGMF